eukprot:30011-Chlamydomonas_euryale.AAC.3
MLLLCPGRAELREGAMRRQTVERRKPERMYRARSRVRALPLGLALWSDFKERGTDPGPHIRRLRVCTPCSGGDPRSRCGRGTRKGREGRRAGRPLLSIHQPCASRRVGSARAPPSTNRRHMLKYHGNHGPHMGGKGEGIRAHGAHGGPRGEGGEVSRRSGRVAHRWQHRRVGERTAHSCGWPH